MLELQQDANLVHQQAAYVEKHLDDWSYLAADTVGKVGYVAQKLVGPLGLVDVVGTTVRVGVWVEEGGLRRTADSVKDTAQRAADSVRDTAQKTSDYVKDAIKNTARDVDAGMRNWARNASGY